MLRNQFANHYAMNCPGMGLGQRVIAKLTRRQNLRSARSDSIATNLLKRQASGAFSVRSKHDSEVPCAQD